MPSVSDSTDELYVEIEDTSKLSLDKAVDWVECPKAGAVATFSGVVRDNSEGRAVDHLEYEAYVPMAVKTMKGICQDLLDGNVDDASTTSKKEEEGKKKKKKHLISKIFMAHRVGSLKIGEAAVIIAVSAPHRADAISASRMAIDELKKQVPIFKKEVFKDGQTWKSNRP
jgi:molybdopterin synthase catalytic subunit